jgi:hypothetical protein
MRLETISRHSNSRKAQLQKTSSITRLSGSRSCTMMPFITRYVITLLLRAVLTQSQNQEEVTGFGEHRIIVDILRDALFDDSKSYGVKYSRYFNPISINLIALVFTMVRL